MTSKDAHRARRRRCRAPRLPRAQQSCSGPLGQARLPPCSRLAPPNVQHVCLCGGTCGFPNCPRICMSKRTTATHTVGPATSPPGTSRKKVDRGEFATVLRCSSRRRRASRTSDRHCASSGAENARTGRRSSHDRTTPRAPLFLPRQAVARHFPLQHGHVVSEDVERRDPRRREGLATSRCALTPRRNRKGVWSHGHDLLGLALLHVGDVGFGHVFLFKPLSSLHRGPGVV